MDWSLAISILALCGSAFTYFVHDGKIKRQERKINEHQLAKITEEQIERKKASIKANLIKRPGGNNLLKIYNSGKSAARNVRMETSSDADTYTLLERDEIFPFEIINPQEGTEVVFLSYEGATVKIKFKFIWDDEYQLDNIYEQIITV